MSDEVERHAAAALAAETSANAFVQSLIRHVQEHETTGGGTWPLASGVSRDEAPAAVLALAVHALLLHNGYVAMRGVASTSGAGPAGFAPPIRPMPEGEFVPLDWRSAPGVYGATYRAPNGVTLQVKYERQGEDLKVSASSGHGASAKHGSCDLEIATFTRMDQLVYVPHMHEHAAAADSTEAKVRVYAYTLLALMHPFTSTALRASLCELLSTTVLLPAGGSTVVDAAAASHHPHSGAPHGGSSASSASAAYPPVREAIGTRIIRDMQPPGGMPPSGGSSMPFIGGGSAPMGIPQAGPWPMGTGGMFGGDLAPDLRPSIPGGMFMPSEPGMLMGPDHPFFGLLPHGGVIPPPDANVFPGVRFDPIGPPGTFGTLPPGTVPGRPGPARPIPDGLAPPPDSGDLDSSAAHPGSQKK